MEDDLRTEMQNAFDRFFNRSFDRGYSWAQFEIDALAILNRALQITAQEREDAWKYNDLNK